MNSIFTEANNGAKRQFYIQRCRNLGKLIGWSKRRNGSIFGRETPWLEISSNDWCNFREINQ